MTPTQHRDPQRPDSRAAAAAPGGGTGPSAGAGSAPAQSISHTSAARAEWVRGAGAPAPRDQCRCTARPQLPSAQPGSPRTKPSPGEGCGARSGQSLGAQAQSSGRAAEGPPLTCSTALLLSLLELRREGAAGRGLWAVPPVGTAPCRGTGCPGLGAPARPSAPPARPSRTRSRGRLSGRGTARWQLSCSHRSHRSPQRCRLLTLLSERRAAAQRPPGSGERCGLGGRGWGSSRGAAGRPSSATSPSAGARGRSNAGAPQPLPVPQPCPRSPLLLQAQRDVLVVAEVVGAGVIEGAVGQPHGVTPNRVWGSEGRGQESAHGCLAGTVALPDCHSETPHPARPGRRPPGSPRPPSPLGCVTRSRPRDW